jgi:hypothetical protein
MLKIKLKDMDEHIAKQYIEIVELKKDVAQLKERDYPITIREGFRTLEQQILNSMIYLFIFIQ